MSRSNVIQIVLFFAVVGGIFLSGMVRLGQADSFQCGTEESDIVFTNDPVDTIKGVAIYGAWDAPSRSDTLPTYWEVIWDSTEQRSVPQYFIDNTNSRHVVYCHPYGKDSLTAFTSTSEPRDSALLLINFTKEILARADTVIDFSKYVPTGDTTVSHVWLVVVNYDHQPEDDDWPSFNRLKSPWFLETNDTTSSGQTVYIKNTSGSTIRGKNDENKDMSESIHEYCHDFGWPDFYYEHNDPTDTLIGIGGFDIMAGAWGMRHRRTAPICPYHKTKVGWIEPTEIAEPSYQQSIAHFMTSDHVYKILHEDSQYFLATNHSKQNEQLSYWEYYFPNWGLIIWHIDERKDRSGTRGKVDVECAHGLWDWDRFDPIEENPISGLDSLDRGADYGPKSNLWNDSIKTVFDHSSNPTSRCFPHGDSIAQTLRSYIAVRNIAGDQNDTGYADLLVNNWYGTLPGNTTWGPSKTYAITGDLTVSSGDTLFLLPSTTLKFQVDEDNQTGGQDTTRCELIVRGHIEADAHGSVITFTSSASSPDKGDWYGIRLTPQSSGDFSNCIIKYGQFGIRSNQAELDVDSCEIWDSYQHGIFASGTQLSVSNTDIQNSGLDGIRCFRSDFELMVNHITDSRRYGIFCDSAAAESADSVYIVGNTIRNDSTGSTYTGIDVRAYDNYRVFGNKIKQFRVGLSCWSYSSGFLASNNVDSCDYYGLVCGNSSSPLVRSNTIKRVMYGVRASGDSYPDLGDTSQTGDGNNSIYSTSSYRVWNYNSGPSATWIKAENNWWGSINPDSSWFEGLVSWIPYLDSDPNQSKLIAQGQVGLPEAFKLYQNYPNPFNPTTVIEYDVPKASQVLIEIYNLLGRKVATLRDAHEEAGHKAIRWDGRSESGSSVATGVYFCSMKAGETWQVQKMVVIR